MLNLSMIQALSLWTDLAAAYYGKSKYGGDTAEIYIYRLMPYEPTCATGTPKMIDDAGLVGQMMREAYEQPNAMGGQTSEPIAGRAVTHLSNL